MQLKVTIEIWQKGKWYVATCPELDFVSQGTSPEEARRNLLEVIEIQFEEMQALGTLEDYLLECGYVQDNGALIPQSELVSFEKSAVQVA
jgi:predicted RNase H-like HicB family nuclease